MAEIAQMETQEEFKEKSCSLVKHYRWSERARKNPVMSKYVKIAFPNFVNSSSISVGFLKYAQLKGPFDRLMTQGLGI